MSITIPSKVQDLFAGVGGPGEGVLRIDGLVRILVAAAVDDLLRTPDARTRLGNATAALALPFTPSLVDFLESYADDLAENVRPAEGVRHELLQFLLLASFATPGAAAILDEGAEEGFVASTQGMSFVRLVRTIHPILSGARPAPRKLGKEGQEALARRTLELCAVRAGRLGAARFMVVRGVRPHEGKTRITLAPLGGSMSQAVGATVTWAPSPQDGDLALVDGPFASAIRLAPWLRYDDPCMALLCATARAPVPRYVAYTSEGCDLMPELDDAGALRLVPWATTLQEMQEMREIALRQISDQSVAIGASMVSELSEADVTEGSLLAERFELKRELARGTLSAVFEALELATSEHVVIKVLTTRSTQSASQAERELVAEAFVREAQILDSLRHEALPRLLHDGTRTYPPFIAIEALPPRTLRDVLTPPVALPRDRANRIVLQLGDVVRSLHQEGIVHRDIKPENILVDDEDVVHLIDFGLARLRASHGVIVDDVGGTVPYIAPESMDGKRIDLSCDVFALGCILYECLTGRPLFAGGTRREAAQKIRKGQRASSSAIPMPLRDALYDVVHASTEPDPARRLRDADLFLAFLEKAISGERPTPNRREGGMLSRLFGR